MTTTLPKLRINGDRLRADFDELALIGATPEGGISRLALSLADQAARAWLADRIEAAGLLLQDDDAGNVSGVLRCPDEDAKTLLLGSHLDSVPNGGRYDGAVGVLAALECLRTVSEAGMRLPVHLEVINFTDDEGCWKSLFGSRALAGTLGDSDLSTIRNDNDPFMAALAQAGLDVITVPLAQRDREDLAGYLELHIEQGPRLERAGLNIGVVTNIVGRSTYAITFYGQAGHSGTTDMYQRRDALRGAAQFIVRAHDLVRARYGDGIFNCGNVEVKPGKFNIIPSQARLTVECRHTSEALMAEMEAAVQRLARECAVPAGLEVRIEQTARMAAAAMSSQVIQAIETACDRLDMTRTRLVSYAGHDAQTLAPITPSGMIFIPSVNGIGHSPQEFTAWHDVENGANVLLAAALHLAETL